MAIPVPSPVKRWPGVVTVSSPLTYPQYAAWWEALQTVTDGMPEGVTFGQIIGNPKTAQQILPGVLACVEKWELGGGFPSAPTLANFPATPPTAAAHLLLVLVNAIGAIVAEEDASPPA